VVVETVAFEYAGHVIIRDRTSCVTCHAQESHRGVWNRIIAHCPKLIAKSYLRAIFNFRKADDAVLGVIRQDFFQFGRMGSAIIGVSRSWLVPHCNRG